MVRFEKKKKGFDITVPSIFCVYLERNRKSGFFFLYYFVIFFTKFFEYFKQNFSSIFCITFFWMVRLEKKKKGIYIFVFSIFCTYLEHNRESGFFFFNYFVTFLQNFSSILSQNFFLADPIRKKKKTPRYNRPLYMCT